MQRLQNLKAFFENFPYSSYLNRFLTCLYPLRIYPLLLVLQKTGKFVCKLYGYNILIAESPSLTRINRISSWQQGKFVMLLLLFDKFFPVRFTAWPEDNANGGAETNPAG